MWLSVDGNEPIWANKGKFIGSLPNHVTNLLEDFSSLYPCVGQPELVETFVVESLA